MEETEFNSMEETSVMDTDVDNSNNTIDTVQGSDEVEIDISMSGTQETQAVIAEIPSAFYGGFVKILSFLAQGMSSQDTFFIKDGKLVSKKSAGFIYSNMQELFDENDFEILDPANAVKLLGLIKGGDKTVFLRDEDEKEYVITNMKDGEPDRIVTLSIPEVHPDEVTEIPNIGEKVSELEVDVARIEDIINAQKATDSAYYLLNFDNDFKLYSIETSNKNFKDIFEKENGAELSAYKLFDLMMISKPDSFKIEIYKNGDDIWLKTISDIGLVEIEYVEKIDKSSDFDAFDFM